MGAPGPGGRPAPWKPVRWSHRLDARSPGSPFAAVPRGLLGPSPSLPDALEAPHPGQSLLLLGAQVPNSAAHGALSPVSRTSLPFPPPGLFLPGASDVGPAPAPWRAPLLPRPIPPALRPGSGTFPTIAKTHPTRGREVTCPRGIPEHRLQAGSGSGEGHQAPPTSWRPHPRGSHRVPGTGKTGGHQRHVGNFQGSHQISFPTNLINLVHPSRWSHAFLPTFPWSCPQAGHLPVLPSQDAEWFQPSR